MKNTLTFLFGNLLSIYLAAQTNTFPSSGNAGIGTTSPYAKLSIYDAAYNSPQITIDNSGTYNMRIGISSGNIGFIGSSNSTPVQIQTAGIARSTWDASGNFTHNGGNLSVSSGYIYGQLYGGIPAYLLNSSGSYLGNIFNLNSSTWGLGYNTSATNYGNAALVWNTSGNIGIGTTTPSAKLSVYDASANSPQITIDNSSTYNMRIGINTANKGFIGSTNATPVQVQTGGVARTTWDINGNILHDGGNISVSNGHLYSHVYNGTPAYLLNSSGSYLGNIFNLNSSTWGLGYNTSESSYGNAALVWNTSGNIGIGTTSPGEKLTVNGFVKAKKIVVSQVGWSDYVFNEEYNLRSLSSLESFIKVNRHLPEIPSAKEVEENGISVGDNQALLLKKIEELTLYIINQEKRITTLETQLKNRK